MKGKSNIDQKYLITTFPLIISIEFSLFSSLSLSLIHAYEALEHSGGGRHTLFTITGQPQGRMKLKNELVQERWENLYIESGCKQG